MTSAELEGVLKSEFRDGSRTGNMPHITLLAKVGTVQETSNLCAAQLYKIRAWPLHGPAAGGLAPVQQ